MNTIDKAELTESLKTLGFDHKVSSPVPSVGDGDWPSIKYQATLLFNGKEILTTDYSLGVGHVNHEDTERNRLGLTTGQQVFLQTWAKNQNAQFKDKELWASTATALAVRQKVSPSLPDLLHSLLSDGEAFLQGQSFEEWADNFGYDKDSRKAEKIYRACDDIGRKLSRVPAKALEDAGKLLQDY